MMGSGRKKIYEEGAMKAQKSESSTRLYRQVGKLHNDSITKRVNNRSLNRLDLTRSLLGKPIKTDLADDFGEIYAFVVKVYPHMVRCQYTYKKKDKDKKEKCIISEPLNICFTTADLVEKGIISFATGRAEVVK